MAGKNQLIDQCRKPAGWLGRFLLWGWNIRHSRVTDWGLRHVAIAQRDTILDVGCGGGRTVRKLAGVATQGRVCGVDHSEESVAAARRTNRHGIATGRVEIRLGSVSNLPFDCLRWQREARPNTGQEKWRIPGPSALTIWHKAPPSRRFPAKRR